MFSLCDLIGTFAGPSEFRVFQPVYIVVLLLTLVAVLIIAYQTVHERIGAIKKSTIMMHNNNTNDMFATYSKREKILLAPILALVYVTNKMGSYFLHRNSAKVDAKVAPEDTTTQQIKESNPIAKKEWNQATENIIQQNQTHNETERVEQESHLASIRHQNETMKRKYEADLRLQQRLAAKNPTKVMPRVQPPQYIPLPRYSSNSSSGSNNTRMKTLVVEKVTSEQATKIQEESDRSRMSSNEKTKRKKEKADNNLQKRLALRQRAKQERALKKCALFQHLSDAAQDQIVDVMLFEKIKEGTTVCEQGNAGDKMYLLMKGHCSVFVNQLHVANLYELEIFGEGVVVTNQNDSLRRSATVVAEEDIEVLVLSDKDLKTLMQTNVFDSTITEELQKLIEERKNNNELLRQEKKMEKQRKKWQKLL